MKIPRVVFALTALVCLALPASAAINKIVLIAGRPSHGPLQHEHRAGCLLLQKCLRDVPNLVTKVYDNGWPTVMKDGKAVDDDSAFDGADAIIIYSDGGGGHPALQGDRLQLLERLTRSGVGLGLIHYAVEPTLEKGQKEFHGKPIDLFSDKFTYEEISSEWNCRAWASPRPCAFRCP